MIPRILKEKINGESLNDDDEYYIDYTKPCDDEECEEYEDEEESIDWEDE